MMRLMASVRSYLLPAIVLVLTWSVMTSISETFGGAASIYAVLEGFPLIGLVALGLAITIIAGELDLSVASMAALAAVLAILCSPLGLVGAVAVATLAGLIFGAVQGTLIAVFRINSLVFTIGTLILLRGLTYIASGHAPIYLQNFEITDPLLDRYGVFSLSSITALVVFALIGLFLSFTRWGREIYAIGGARNEAIAAGVPRIRPLALAFALSAACASLAGAMAAMRSASAAPENYADLLLSAAAAALLGGVSLYGGRGTVFNVALGVGILSVIGAGLVTSPASLVQLVTGALLLSLISLEFLAGRLRLSETVFGRNRRRLGTPSGSG